MNITRQIYLIGIGMGSRNTRTLLTESILEQCDCIIGASRMLESVQEYKKPQFALINQMKFVSGWIHIYNIRI